MLSISIINKQPIGCDAQLTGTQSRKANVWGNCPGANCPVWGILSAENVRWGCPDHLAGLLDVHVVVWLMVMICSSLVVIQTNINTETQTTTFDR